MKKLLIALLFLSGYAHAQVSSDQTIKNQTNSQIRTAPQILGNNEASIIDKLTNSKKSRVEGYTVSGTNTYAVTVGWVDSYQTNLEIPVTFTNANTGASTINITGLSGSPLGAKSIVKNGSAALTGSEIASGQSFTLRYDGTNFQLLGGAGATVSNASSSTAGIAKLYTTTGSNTDGSMDQNSITSALNGKAPGTSGSFPLRGNGSGGFVNLVWPTSGQLIMSTGIDFANSGVSSDGTTATFGAVPIFPSQTANKFFASPDGSSGSPSFRILASGDIPNNAANTTGSAAKWTTARNLAGNSVDGSANVTFSNKFVVQGTSDTGLSGAQFLGALATGIVKNTTTTGVLSIASAGTDYEFPLTFSTGLTRSTNTITINTSQSISTLSNLTSNGFVTTSGGTGALSVTVPGTGVATWITTPSSANLAAALTDETGTGADVFAGSPAFTGTPTYGTLSYSDTDIAFSFQKSVNSYFQIPIQNTNSGSTASVDVILSNDVGTATTHYGDLGMNSSGFTGSGSLNIANAVYLYASDDDLVLATKANKSLHFVTNNATTDNLSITGAGVMTFNGSSTAIHKELFPSLGTTQTDGAGIWLQNSTAATNGNQQISPLFTQEGMGFGTGVNTSQSVKFAQDVLPVQAATNPTGTWRLRQSVNGASYADVLTMTSTGVLTIGTGTSFLNSNTSTIVLQGSSSEGARFASIGNKYGLLLGATSSNAMFYAVTPNMSSFWVEGLRVDAGTFTALTANTEFRHTSSRGATWTWLDGTVPIQEMNFDDTFVLNGTTTLATFTDAYGRFTKVPTAGAKGAITRAWGIGTNGNLQVQGKAYIGAASVAPVEALEISGNARSNNFIDGYTSTATAAGTTTLTISSNYYQTFTGSTTQTVTLPVVTTLYNGVAFRIINLSSGVVTVQTSGSNTIKAMAANSTLDVWVKDTTGGTGTASWNWYYNTSVNN